MKTSEILRKVKKIEIKSRGLSQNVFAGQYHSAFKGRGMSFAEVREYQFGDDVRDIDWNVTAKMGHPFIKVYEEERELTVMLMIDVSGSLNFGTKHQMKKDMVAEMAATLAFSAIETGDKVGVLFFSDGIEKYIAPQKGKRHILRIIREIIEFKPKSCRTNLSQALEFYSRVMRKRTTVFILSDFFIEHELDNVNHLEKILSISSHRHDIIALQVYDPLAKVLPNVGLLYVEDAETGHEMVIDTSNKNIRQAHSIFWLNREKKLLNLFNKLKIDNISVATDENYVTKLMQLFKQRY